MQLTAQDIDHSTGAAIVEGSGLSSRLSRAMHALIAHRQTHHVVQGLSAAQLRDSGIDRAAVLGNHPVIEHDARLATYLASLR